MRFNDFAAWILRSPCHWLMGKSTLLITVTGRKSGQPVTLPVNFYRCPEGLYIISSRDRSWWRNLKSNPHATIWLGGQQRTAQAELLLDEAMVAGQLVKIIVGERWLARALKIRLDEHQEPNVVDLQKTVQERLLVRLKLEA
jgi:deazaflavin-dependent oxidoreductase (nitroreductase family)